VVKDTRLPSESVAGSWFKVIVELDIELVEFLPPLEAKAGAAATVRTNAGAMSHVHLFIFHPFLGPEPDHVGAT
jgi:hypothetical protein